MELLKITSTQCNGLFYPAEPVESLFKLSSEEGIFKTMKADMLRIMEESNGIGLAANQVGGREALFVNGLKNVPSVIINPRIVNASGEQVQQESCLSFPIDECKPLVKRPREIKVTFQTEKGKRKLMHLSGWGARVFCHEIDHLKGITLLDYVEDDIRDSIIKQYGLNPRKNS